MATKHKHRTKQAAAGLVQQARRELEKGDFKQAVKDAKVCYRQTPSPEARCLLEQAYLGRCRQLHRAGLRAESQAAAENLLELGVTDDTVRRELPEVLIAVGLSHRLATVGPTASPLEDGNSPLRLAAADHAVLRPDGAAALPGIGRGAQSVRRALEALEADREAEALALLQDISRGSPLADWKYFVRGLAAYYRQDAAETRANFDRLEPGRFAARIAGALSALSRSDEAPASDLADKTVCPTDVLAPLRNGLAEGRVLGRLQKLQQYLAAGRWREAVKLLSVADEAFRRADPALPQRLAAVVAAALVHKGATGALVALAAVAEPVAIDPRWNRALAMAWEQRIGEDGNGLRNAERHWRAYLDDLAGLECLSASDRRLAQALVWLRLGRMLTAVSGRLCPTCRVRHGASEGLQHRAVECFRNSLRLAPELLATHQALARAYREWDQPSKEATALKRLLKRFPEHLETLLSLAEHHLGRDEPLAAREFAFRARQLKPLDAKIKELVRGLHLASARHYALEGRWDEGRAEFAAAAADGRAVHQLLVQRATFEAKAGDFGLAFRLVDQARNELGEPAPIWLLMAIEGRRYALPKAVADEFETRWLAELKKGRRSAAAGEMCRTMTGHLTGAVDYPGRADHLSRLCHFLGGCKRVKWQSEDLRHVLDFLIMVQGHEGKGAWKPRNAARRGASSLLAHFAAQARRKFPDDAFFQFLVGKLEIAKGPRTCDRRLARECLEQAVKLAEGSSDPDRVETAQNARQSLDFLNTADRLSTDEDEFADELDDDDAEFSEEDESGAFGPEDDAMDDDRALPPKLVDIFTRACREMGVDPEDIIEEIGGLPGPFRIKGFRPARRK
jgi:tetratricopeptide (TPR) repeat protein